MVRISILAAAMLFLAACTTPMHPTSVRNIKSSADLTKLEKGQAIAFGKIDVISSIAPDRWTETDCFNDIYWTCPQSFRLVFLRIGDPTPITHRLTGAGDFAVPLAPGRYMLAEWQWHTEGNRHNQYLAGTIPGTFEIPSRRKATYLGDIAIRFSGRRYNYELSDKFDIAVKRLEGKFPSTKLPTERNLITIERLPTGKALQPICAGQWGIACGKTYQGVEPISPAQSKDDFPTVASLTPTLTWKPAAARDISYDIAVFEVVPYGPPLAKRYIQGPLHEYAEAQPSPSYTLATPLKPKTKYFWSVRARKGETVSNWSSMTYSKFGFYIVAFTSKSESHVSFRLQTP